MSKELDLFEEVDRQASIIMNSCGCGRNLRDSSGMIPSTEEIFCLECGETISE